MSEYDRGTRFISFNRIGRVSVASKYTRDRVTYWYEYVRHIYENQSFAFSFDFNFFFFGARTFQKSSNKKFFVVSSCKFALPRRSLAAFHHIGRNVRNSFRIREHNVGTYVRVYIWVQIRGLVYEYEYVYVYVYVYAGIIHDRM